MRYKCKNCKIEFKTRKPFKWETVEGIRMKRDLDIMPVCPNCMSRGGISIISGKYKGKVFTPKKK